MKYTIAIASLAASGAAANLCSGFYSDDNGQSEVWYSELGFEDAAECEAHPCSATHEDLSDWVECHRGAQELEGRKYNHIVKMAKSQMNTSHSLRRIFRMLQNYGCHCFPGQTREAGGHGPAVDAQDSLCKDLARCHRCVEMDHGADTIDVNEAKYRFKVVNGEISCDRNSEKGWHQSKRDLCECDARFATALGKIWSDADFNEYYWLHPKEMKAISKGKLDPVPAKFDMLATCEVIGGGKADACCGGYPERYPYDTNEKSCCGNSAAYRPAMQECCENGEVVAVGDC